MELGRKSRARQPMATKFSSDRGLSQETRGKTVGEDGLSEDQRGIKEKRRRRSKNLSACPLPVRGYLHSPPPLWLLLLRQTGLDMLVGEPGLQDEVAAGLRSIFSSHRTL